MRGLKALGVLVLATLSVWAHDRIEARRDAFPADVDVLYVPQARYLAPMSVGYREALAGSHLGSRAHLFRGSDRRQ